MLVQRYKTEAAEVDDGGGDIWSKKQIPGHNVIVVGKHKVNNKWTGDFGFQFEKIVTGDDPRV